jgi:hypothetical protein
LVRIRPRRVSPAFFIACLALAVSLGGTSYAAASKLARNTVGTAQLKDNAVTSDKVRDFSLRLWDFKKGQLPRGPVGPPGPAGKLGDLIAHESAVTVPGNAAGNGLYVSRSISVRCHPGERAVTGGTTWSTDADDAELITVYSRPLIENGVPVGWRSRGGSDMATDRVFTVQVLCIAT